jgi:hypothetical protein
MKRSARQFLMERLEDERSKRVIFVSHCLLNENTRCLGGAFRPGGVNEPVDGFQQEGLGTCQMHCPEQRAWGGVLKRFLLPMYTSRGTLPYRLRHVLLPLFLWYTRWRCRCLAKEVVRDIEDYVHSDFEIVAWEARPRAVCGARSICLVPSMSSQTARLPGSTGA